jgi:NTE family protein
VNARSTAADRRHGVESPAALVLCGGASRGAIEVGFYRALCELDIGVALIVGSSIGAFNGACIASGMSAHDIERLWRRFSAERLIGWNWRGLFQPRRFPGLYSLERIRRLLRGILPVLHFEDLRIPLVIVTTDLQQGAPVYWKGAGDLVEPLIASMSIPGIFPPVTIGGRQFVDGSIADNLPIAQAVARGARTILTTTCGGLPAPATPARGLVGVLSRCFGIMLDCRHAADAGRFAHAVTIHAIAPVLPRPVGILDFRHTDELIELGHRETLAYFTQEMATSANAEGFGAGRAGPGQQPLDAPLKEAQ